MRKELKPGDLIDERYSITSGTGIRGGMATIFPATDIITGATVAIKVADSDTMSREGLNREASILRKLHPHPNIIHYIGETLVGDDHALILEWANGDLGSRIAQFKNENWPVIMESIADPLLSALNKAHSDHFQHRDVHPGNIMFSNVGQLRLIDFGIAQVPKPRVGATFFRHGSPPYTPEDQNDAGAGFARDCYAAIVVFVSCIHGRILTSYSDLNTALSELSPENYPTEIFRSCVERYPHDCPKNAGILRAKLQHWTHIRFPSFTSFRVLVQKPAQGLLSELDAEVAWSDILEDLTSGSLINVEEESDSSEQLHVAGQNYRGSFALVNAATGTVRLTGKVRLNKGSWSQGFTPFMFSFIEEGVALRGSPWHRFVEGYESAKDAETARLTKARLELPFISWENYLGAEQALLVKKPTYIKYFNLLRLSDREFRFEIDSSSAKVLSEDVALVSGSNKRNLIRVVQIDENSVFVRSKYNTEIPVSGSFSVEYHAIKQALNRKRRALFSVKDGLSVNSDLRQYLTEPSTVLPPEMSGRTFNIDDPHQARAVDAALGAPAWIMIEGPPGTGKSTVIAHIIKQFRAQQKGENPRILLAAQTHIALDTVLKKLLEDETMISDIVRIPSGDHDKIDILVKPLLVENKVKAFRGAAISRSEVFLEAYASANGGDHRIIRLAIYAGLYNAVSDECVTLEAALVVAERHTKSAIENDDLSSEPTAEVVSKTVSMVTAEDLIREELGEAKSRLKRLAGQINDSVPELVDALNSAEPAKSIKEYYDVFEPELLGNPTLANLVNLQLEWLKAITAGRALHQSIVQDSSIVAGTCVGIGAAIAEQEFDLCIVDEASKALPVEALIPMSRAKKWILVGDVKQLPPHVDREIHIPDGESQWSSKSLLEMLPKVAQESNGLQEQSWCFELKNQRRMTRGISDLIGEVFYEKKLNPLRLDSSRDKIIAKAFPKPVTWVDVNGTSREAQQGTRSLYNLREIDAIVQQLYVLEKVARRSTIEAKITVAVIAGYAAQVDRLLEKIDELRHQWPSLAIEVASIDRFQGNEKEVAIVSLVRGTNERTLGHLDEKRINVAFSRAKDALVIVGAAAMVDKIGQDTKLAEVLQYIRKNSHACTITSPK